MDNGLGLPRIDAYRRLVFDGPIRRFPMLKGVNEYAERFGPCRRGNWDRVLAHAHWDRGWICVRGPANPNLWGNDEQLTSLFLHEYAHLLTPGGHTNAFWAANRALHKQYKVTHSKFENALASVIGGLLIAGLGVGLFLLTGWGFFAFGSILGILFAIPGVLDSFGTEQQETYERECGNRR